MKNLNVKINDEIYQKVKIFAFENNLTMSSAVEKIFNEVFNGNRQQK